VSQGKTGGEDCRISLDVHDLSRLKSEGVPPTDDSPKYNYKPLSDEDYPEYGIHYKYIQQTNIKLKLNTKRGDLIQN
jgi:hypothetical protein